MIRYLTIFARNTDGTAGIDTAFDGFSNFSFTLNICCLKEDQDLDNDLYLWKAQCSLDDSDENYTENFEISHV